MPNILKLIVLFFSLEASAQEIIQFENVQPDDDYENVLSKKIFSDERASTFIIWVKKSVALHYHAQHTEQVYILEGEGDMLLGNKVYHLKPGDYILIPQGMAHSVVVTSDYPMKVLSIQAPEFDGTDRVFINENE